MADLAATPKPRVDAALDAAASLPRYRCSSVAQSFDKLRFTIQENDVLLKVSVPSAFRYLQLRKLGDQWKVVVEY